MLVKDVESTEGLTVILKRMPIESGLNWLLSVKTKDPAQSRLVHKKLFNDINPHFFLPQTIALSVFHAGTYFHKKWKRNLLEECLE
jgi:hypothetical protein